MDNARSTVFERTTLTFCVEGLQAREELLVKAFIRLLDHLTHQQWRYQVPDGKAHIDLLLAAPGSREAFAARHGKLPAALLELSSGGENGHGVLSWPLKPDALEKELNRLGGLATTEPVRAGTVKWVDTAPAALSDEPGAPPKAMRLTRWPPVNLLAGSGRMRLATLLTGKSMGLAELAHRSGLPLRTCQVFVNELQLAGLLRYPTPSENGTTDGSAVLSNESNSPMSKRYDTHSTRLPGVTSAQPGLLARIRTRLGLSLGLGSSRAGR